MFSFVLVCALSTPGDPLIVQVARLSALESAIATAAPPDYNDSRKVVHRRVAIHNVARARQEVDQWIGRPVYQPFGYPASGGIFLGPDYLDGFLSKAESHFAASF